MQSRIPLLKFVYLGQQLWFLLHPEDANVNGYFIGIRDFIETLVGCGLPQTRQAANTLASIHTIYSIPGSQRIDQTGVNYFQAMMAPIRDRLIAEAGTMEVVAVKSGEVSQQLRSLPAIRALNNTQQELLTETILCLEAAAYRAAIVMGWNLAYDVIRQWVFDKHLAAFNQALASYLQQRCARYSPIQNYEDFFKGEPGERTVIDTCFRANIPIGGKLRDNLHQHLRRRNDYAHRSFTAPTPEQANAYIHEMIDIVTCPPFV